MLPSELTPEVSLALTTCTTFLSALKSKDRKIFTSLLHPSGQICNARYRNPAQGSLLFHDFKTQLQSFLENVFTSPSIFDEAIDEGRDTTVLVDGDIATVWTPYWFRVDGALSHVGTNSFGLAKVVKEKGEGMDGTGASGVEVELPSGGAEDGNWEWKIVALHDTARMATMEEKERLDREYAERK